MRNPATEGSTLSERTGLTAEQSAQVAFVLVQESKSDRYAGSSSYVLEPPIAPARTCWSRPSLQLVRAGAAHRSSSYELE